MGYYTKFTVNKPNQWSLELKDSLIEISDEFWDRDTVDEFIDGELRELKWYNFKSDLSTLSEKFPDILFEIQGFGEDVAEWKAWFKNGRSFTSDGRVVFNEYDETKLK